MSRATTWTFAGVALLLSIWPAHAVDVLRWERLPLAVPLVIGQERVVLLDHEVRVGVPASVADRLRVQSAGGALYLRADAALEPTRLQLQDIGSSRVMLLDVATLPEQTPQPTLAPVRIVDGTDPQRAADVAGQVEGAPPETARQWTPVPVVLTRFAAQSLYAPLRTVEYVPGITAVPVAGQVALTQLLPMLPVQAQALAAWRMDDHWVTAVRLRHRGPQWLSLDPRLLQGDFLTATFQHDTLGPAGTAEDTTVVYLVTRGRALGGAVLPSIRAFDSLPHVPAPTTTATPPAEPAP